MDEIGYLIKRAQHALRLTIDNALAALGLPLPQYIALVHIQNEAGISNAELARRAFVTPQTMHRVVTGLAERGLLAIESHPQLERVKQIFVTATGQALLAASAEIMAAAEAAPLAAFSEAEQETFRAMLERYLSALATGSEDDDV
ncbi:MAG: winged helix-turn-helix transcriptional regulator [Anaerolineales bacterium]|nr:winged helix-turn-helix transcriptional regulator [Anaerolineales bacterium]